MSRFNQPQQNPLEFVKIRKAKDSHIKITDQGLCQQKCENKPCTYFCPSRVYSWENQEIKIDYGRCIECGACPWGCPYKNIDWHLPPGGYGVDYSFKDMN